MRVWRGDEVVAAAVYVKRATSVIQQFLFDKTEVDSLLAKINSHRVVVVVAVLALN